MKKKLPLSNRKCIKAATAAILAFVTLMCSASACSRGEQGNESKSEQEFSYNGENLRMVMNEYELFKEECEKSAETTGLADQNAYVGALCDLTAYTETELKSMGYSSGNIAIVEKLRENPGYVPTDEELLLAAATFRFNIACSDSYVRDTRSYYDFIWSFTWVTAPVVKHTDCVAIQWLGDFYMDENAIEASVTYVGADAYGEDVSHTEDYESEMRMGINPAAQGCCLEFPAGMYIDSETYVVEDSGRGSFRLRCSEHGHPDVSIGWLYAHYQLGITSVNVTFGNSLPSITLGGNYDKMAEGSRTYYAN